MKRFVTVAVIGLILLVLSLYLHSKDLQINFKSPGSPTIIAPQQITDPLMITEMRKRSYPGGQINIEEDLGIESNHHVYIISYPSDSLKLRALMSYPTSPAPSGGFPVIILNHGFIAPSQYSTVDSYRSFFDFYAENSFVVVKPDYRGHDQSEGVATSGHFSPDYTIDVLNLLYSIKKYPGVNPSRIGMWGHSMGGHVTLRAIVVSKDIKATVIAGGVVGSAYDIFYNWTRRVPEIPPNIGSVSGRLKLVAKYGDPKTNPDFWNQVSSINYVSYIAGPIQLHAGTADEEVPKLFSDHLDQALIKAGKSVEYFEYPGGDHNFTGVYRAPLLQRSLEFFQKNL